MGAESYGGAGKRGGEKACRGVGFMWGPEVDVSIFITRCQTFVVVR